MSVDFEKLNAIANSDEALLMKLLPNAIKRGNELVCGDIYGSKGESFSYNIKSGLWADFGTQTSGASVIDLVRQREGVSYKEAAEMVDKELGGISNINAPVVNKKPSNNNEQIKSVTAPKGSHAQSVWRDGKAVRFTNVWVYRNKDGFPVACDGRIDYEDGSKEVIPMLYNGEKWYSKALPENRYLYNLDKIVDNPDKTVIIAEGCKTADAVATYFPNYVSTTWQGGSNATSKTDWAPLFGRKVIIVPDADEPGRKAANKIADKLTKQGSHVRLVTTTSMEEIKKGWDIADALADGMSQEEIVDFFKKNLGEYVPAPTSSEDVIDPEVIIKNKAPTLKYDDTYFRCLGVQGDTHFFYKKQTSQIIEFRPSSYDSKHLINLAPLTWWQMNYPDKSGVNWAQATDDLCRLQEKVGIFDNTKIRGRGAWFDEGRTVLHLGNVLFTDGKLVDIDDFKSDYFYERAPSLAVKVQTCLPAVAAADLVKLCRMARWEKPCYGDILAGWMFSALVCGAMPFRSHLYLVGAAGTGKSWLLDNIVKRVMGNIALSVSSKSTEAGIRDNLGGDIRPVVFDEAEAENQQDKIRMQAVFDLARNGSSEKADAIVKFGAKYVCRSAFLFASINSSMSKTADLSRTAFIKLANAPVHKSVELKTADNKKFRELEAFASRLLTDEYVRCLLSRAICLVPVIRKSHKVIADLAAKEFGSRRLGDQMAMIIAGLHALQSDNVITEEEARKLISQTALQADKEDADEKTQEENCLDHLLFTQIDTQTRMGNKRYLLNLLVAVINKSEIIDGLEPSSVAQDLSSKGIMIGNIGSLQYMFLSTNKSALPSKLFADSEWEFSWQDALCRIDGISKTANKYFCKTLVSRAIAIPLYMVIKEENTLLV